MKILQMSLALVVQRAANYALCTVVEKEVSHRYGLIRWVRS